jgi:Tfp pilus assembly protein PilZ
MIIAKIFVLIQQLDKNSLLDRLSVLKDPAYQWVREYPRLNCLMLIDFAAQGRAYRSCIRDISAKGMFIETSESFEPGQELALCFTLSEANESMPFKVKGRVTRAYPGGIGVQYEKITHYQREILNTLINKIS